jgi:hypothetical protein
MSPISPDLPLAAAVDLNEVLDVSFFDSDPCDNELFSNVSAEPDSKKHLKNLDRWDIISVGTFRQTVETKGNSEIASGRWSSETVSSPTEHNYGHGIKKTSLETMLYNKSSTSLMPSLDVTIPPARDGNRTPTNLAQTRMMQDDPNQQHTPRKKRKEARKEKKKPFKSSVPLPRKQQNYKHYHHPHYPNTKMRGSNSMQRTNFFSSPGSSVPSLNS